MAYKTSYELHHHFPRLAEESGFTFNTHRPRVHIDWNKIKLIDIDNLIRERKFVLIEQHLNDILDCVFESEFDVRILDEGVMKMFRLAQLAVEYQQFCRHYLDRSVYVLREEINCMAKELDNTKKQLQEKDEELRKLKKRSRHSFKTPLPYGNDNIAAMILKTLSNKGDVFPSTTNADSLQHNKCNYCEKVFLNQLYLQSHITRRHREVLETPQKEGRLEETSDENAKLSKEIMELKTKLKDMEHIIIQNSLVNTKQVSEPTNTVTEKELQPVNDDKNKKNMKDAEVSTNNEEYLLNKFEEWKKVETEKYNNEIKMLKDHILETFNSIKEKQINKTENKDPAIIEQLQQTIVQQGAEIMALKHELTNTKEFKEKENTEKNKETEAQIAFWSKREEAQAKQYESLLQKLNDVARDAKESRALAEAEKQRAAQLQTLLHQSLTTKSTTIATSTEDLTTVDNRYQLKHQSPMQETLKPKRLKNSKQKLTASRQTLENLHKKAQELLQAASVSSVSSDSSTSEENLPITPKSKNTLVVLPNNHPKKPNKTPEEFKVDTKMTNKYEDNKSPSKNKTVKDKRVKPQINSAKDVVGKATGSPVRVVRAKITEEVNNRIVNFGADPLKIRLPHNVYQKQRMELQRLYDIKAKKNPLYQKTKYNLLAKLDAESELNKATEVINEYISPNKVNKGFRSLTTMISNVKSKALSLVKSNENVKEKRKRANGDVTRKAMGLLSTPPSSARETPVKVRNTENHDDRNKLNPGAKLEKKYQIMNRKETIDHDEKDDTVSEESIASERIHINQNNFHKSKSNSSKSIDNLIKSPARRPSSADKSLDQITRFSKENGDLFTRTQSVANLTETKAEVINTQKLKITQNDNSSDDIESLSESPIKKFQSDENIQYVKQTKGVLKNASSTSSLNKKKVLFDMDAIQMKSVSASPSQSLTDKITENEKYELGLVNLDGEEWDISSIENEPLKNDTKIQVNTRTSPKIAELKHAIESQLARRNDTPTTAIVGGVDILTGTGPNMVKPASIGGSNTSLGSSILDESVGMPTINHKAFVKPRKVSEKDDSEMDISEFSIEGITNKNGSF